MSHYAQQPAVLTLEPGSQVRLLSRLRRLVNALAAAARETPEAKPVTHPWRTWHWFT